MRAIRTVLDMPTRRRKSRPETLPMTFIRNNKRYEEQVPIADAIPAFVLPELGPPEVYSDMTHYKGLLPGAFEPKVHFPIARIADDHRNEVLKKYSADSVDVPWEINHDDFRRLLAKIGMCEAIFVYGFEQFERIYVRNAILGTDRPAYWVGSDGSYDMHLRGDFDDSSHVLAAIRPKGQEEVWVRIKLWNKSVTPEYIVVVGRLRREYARFLDAHGLIA